jgi:hypothetical protein
MKEELVAFAIIGLAYYYFNIRGNNRCIIMNPICDDTKCIKISSEKK